MILIRFFNVGYPIFQLFTLQYKFYTKYFHIYKNDNTLNKYPLYHF